MCLHRGWKLQRLRMILFPIILREAFCFFVPGSVGYRIRLFFFTRFGGWGLHNAPCGTAALAAG